MSSDDGLPPAAVGMAMGSAAPTGSVLAVAASESSGVGERARGAIAAGGDGS